MAAIRLEAAFLQEIVEHARRCYPDECCGVLLGDDADGLRRVRRVEAVSNARLEERRRRYLIEPDALRRIDERARGEGLDIVGFYHSHPDHPAVPSAFDREQAWPWYTYLIVPVETGSPGAPRAWRLAEDRSRFDEQELTLEEKT